MVVFRDLEQNSIKYRISRFMLCYQSLLSS